MGTQNLPKTCKLKGNELLGHQDIYAPVLKTEFAKAQKLSSSEDEANASVQSQ